MTVVTQFIEELTNESKFGGFNQVTTGNGKKIDEKDYFMKTLKNSENWAAYAAHFPSFSAKQQNKKFKNWPNQLLESISSFHAPRF